MIQLAAPVVLFLTTGLAAQVRPQFTASTPGLNTPAGGQWDVAAAKEALPAGPGGLIDTADCVVAGYIEDNGSGLPRLAVRRSTDGGRTWGAQQVLYTLSAGETLDVTRMRVGVTGYSAFVMMSSGVINARTSAHDVLVWGSEDQGQTWSGPLRMNDGTSTGTAQYDIDFAVMTVDQGLCHVVWEVDYDVPTDEDAMYSACTMATGAVVRVFPETRVSNLAAIGAADVNDVRIAADGSVVAMCWRSNRVGPGYNVVCRVSTNSGSDFASVTETNLTNFVAVTGVDKPQVAVAGNNVYVGWVDNSAHIPANDDDVRIAVSNDAGVTWNTTTVYQALAPGFDAEDPSIVASGNRVAIAWHDERNTLTGTNNNIANDVFVLVDNTAGAGLLAGTVPEIQVNTLSPPPVPGSVSGATLFEMEMVGNTIGIAIEDSWNNVAARNGEDAVLCHSCDGGVTWHSIFISEIGSPDHPGPLGTEGDIDSPRLAITRNRDCVFTYASEPVVFAGPNVVTLSGISLQQFVTQVGTGCVNSTGSVAGLALMNGPAYGELLTFQISNAPANVGLSFVMFGFFDVGGLDLGVIGMPGCPLHTNGVFALLAPTDGAGVGTASVMLPNDPLQLGTTFFNQPFVADLGQNAFGAVTGNATRAVVGCR